VARLEIDVSHYQGKIECLENSLARVKSECKSKSLQKTQTEELLSKTQAHLDAVRNELAKKEQQYQQVRRVCCGVENMFTSEYMHSLMVYSGYISDHRLHPR